MDRITTGLLNDPGLAAYIRVSLPMRRERRGPLVAVLDERERQDQRWGRQDHDPVYWAGILAEELGEVAKEAIEIAPFAARGERTRDESLARLRRELVQLAAVAVAAIEWIDRQPIESER